MVRISEKDMAILDILQRNARTPYTEIARALGVTEAAVRKRVRKLEQAGIIKGYRAVVDPRKLGYNVISLIGFDAEPEHYTKVAETVKKLPEVRRLLATTGDHMFLAECWLKNSDDLNVFVRKLENIPGVVRVCPAVLVEELK